MSSKRSKMKLSFNRVLTSFTVVISGEIDHDPEKNETEEKTFGFVI